MKRYCKSLLALCGVFLFHPSTDICAQLGGLGTFKFLEMPSSPRSSALGNSIIATQRGDVGVALQNPALYDSVTHQQLAWSHSFHLAGISNGHVSYGYHLPSRELSLGFGVQYIDYGAFRRADEFGLTQGNFSGRETALRLSLAKHVQDRLSFGISLIAATATFDTYGALGIGATLGAHYRMPKSNAAISIVLRNIGTTVSHFSVREPWQTALVIAFSKRLRYVPFRYYLSMDHLERWDIRTSRLDGIKISPNVGTDEASSFNRFVDNLFRHICVGGELSLGSKEQVQLRFSYDHQRARELGLNDFRSLNGFSTGFGINTSLLRVDYAYNHYHLAGGNNQLAVILYMNRLFSKI